MVAEKADPICLPVRTRKGVEVAVLWALKLLSLSPPAFCQNRESAGRTSIDHVG